MRQEWEAQRGAPATVCRIGGLIQSRIEQHKSERRAEKKTVRRVKSIPLNIYATKNNSA